MFKSISIRDDNPINIELTFNLENSFEIIIEENTKKTRMSGTYHLLTEKQYTLFVKKINNDVMDNSIILDFILFETEKYIRMYDPDIQNSISSQYIRYLDEYNAMIINRSNDITNDTMHIIDKQLFVQLY